MIEEDVLKRIIRDKKGKKLSGCLRQVVIYQTHDRMIVCPGCIERYYCRRHYLKVIK